LGVYFDFISGYKNDYCISDCATGRAACFLLLLNSYEKTMNEAETIDAYILPALKAAGWGGDGCRIRRELRHAI